METLTDVEGLDVGLSLTGFSVGVLEGYVIDQHKRKMCVSMKR